MIGTALKTLIVSVIIGLTVACSAIVGGEADTFNKKAAAALVSVTGARNSAITLYQAKKISVRELADINLQLDKVRFGVDAAQNISVTDLTTAESRLTASLQLLQGIQLALTTRSK